MIVTVFGSSKPVAGDQAYFQALELGRMIADSGHTVATGGYIGTMEAVSRGANQAGGHVIGITCADIEEWRQGSANQYVLEEIKCADLNERLRKLIEICDMAIALPGGPGTLTEIALMWNMMIIKAIPTKKLILVGEGWKQVLTSAFNSMGQNYSPAQRELVDFAQDIGTIKNLLIQTK